MAYLLDYKGTVGIAYYDADVWKCNQRDQAFRDVMEKYPDIEVVADQGYADFNQAGVVGDAILAQYPDVDAIYATWDSPAEQIIESFAYINHFYRIIAHSFTPFCEWLAVLHASHFHTLFI